MESPVRRSDAIDALAAALAAADLETLARCHNGGPRGPTKRATEQYWLKVKENMR